MGFENYAILGRVVQSQTELTNPAALTRPQTMIPPPLPLGTVHAGDNASTGLLRTLTVAGGLVPLNDSQ